MSRHPEPKRQRPALARAALLRLLAAALLPTLAACGAAATLAERPTPQPVFNITPAPTQDIPATQTAYAQRIIPTPTPVGLYVVKPGDTLDSIADSFTTTVDEIIAYNNIADANAIAAGQELIIPILLTPTAASSESPASSP